MTVAGDDAELSVRLAKDILMRDTELSSVFAGATFSASGCVTLVKVAASVSDVTFRAFLLHFSAAGIRGGRFLLLSASDSHSVRSVKCTNVGLLPIVAKTDVFVSASKAAHYC